jgi:uncharacterized protein YaaR (DUF327 family)
MTELQDKLQALKKALERIDDVGNVLEEARDEEALTLFRRFTSSLEAEIESIETVYLAARSLALQIDEKIQARINDALKSVNEIAEVKVALLQCTHNKKELRWIYDNSRKA